jgi:glutathione peroxidase
MSLLPPSEGTQASLKTVYDFSFKTLIGQAPLPLRQFQGNVLLIVNTASRCGFTPQYEGLERLYKIYKKEGFVILGIPSNDFGRQEAGSNEEIACFCKLNYNITFPMASKEAVRGKNAHPFYLWAKERLGLGTAPKWNFHKYLINRTGEVIDYFHSTTSPESERLKEAIEAALKTISSIRVL